MSYINYLDRYEEGFYFAVGGLGDAILLLSSFYPEDPHQNVLFWQAASPRLLLHEFFECFSELNSFKVVSAPRDFHIRAEVFGEIATHPKFKGAAHTPILLDYIREWGRRPMKYRCRLPRRWNELRVMFPAVKTEKNYVGLGCWGSNVNVQHKLRRLSAEEFVALTKKVITQQGIPVIFGSAKDREDFVLPEELQKGVMDLRGCPLQEAFRWLNTCRKLISVDTWYLQWARLVGTSTTVIQTRYDAPLESIFGMPFDPSDKIFIEDWGFEITPLPQLLSG